ncbi:MAG TPA: Ppx/GppA phosphatase family protein [Planctomycetaceae bacterium]|nr:Ppx/GppA phosphatase family protein [Planctomycetaceae bacterium]
MESLRTTSDSHVVAFMDIGTNSVRLLLARIHPNHSYSVISQQKEVVRLGEGEFREHQLQPGAMRRAVLVCSKFVEMAHAHGAESVIAVATSASREAANQGIFLKMLRREADLDVRVISGKEEARLIYLGVASGANLGNRRALFIDIGGGSTEVIVGTQQQYDFLDSFKLGAIRLTTLFFDSDDRGPVTLKQYQRLQRHLRATSIRTLQRLRLMPIDLAIGSSGTIMNLAEISCRLLQKRAAQKDEVLTLRDLQQSVLKLCEAGLEERRKIPGINPERADILIAGAAILQTFMEELDLPEIRVSDRGLREGLPIDYLRRAEHQTPLELASFRERSVFQLGRACNFDEPHARNVTRLSLELFDSAQSLGLHNLGEWERELLEYAALLHDVGAFLSYNNHRAHSYYFIRNAELLGFDQTEIRIIAATAYFHRNALPRLKHPEYAELDKRSRKIVLVLCLFLRIAESLDRSHTGAVNNVQFRETGPDELTLEVSSVKDCQLELWGVRHHESAFEKVFGKKLAVPLKSLNLS